MTDSTPRGSHVPAEGPAVGQDEWVARHAERRFARSGPLRDLEERVRRVPWWAWLILFIALFSLLPVVSSSGYVRRVGFDTVIYMLLALGLNVVVGWGGLLDLGYVAFYGIGAYAYAILDSNKFGYHLPTLVSIPLVVALGAVAGFLLGLPSKRLSGDYLAIVTLFFLQLFQTLMTNGDNAFGHDITGGPNGIINIDPFHLFGHDLVVQHQGVFAVSYLYVALAFFAVVFVALRFVNESRTGRAWRSLREDPLAAEAMGMPVSWLKLMSFSFGAAVAALTGTLFAALNGSVFPLTFYFVLLIIVYTMVILGGSGSQAGVVLGAIIVGPLLELLREPGKSRVLFFLALVAALVYAFRRSRTLGAVVGATLAFGFAVHEIARAFHGAWVAGEKSGGFAGAVAHWVVVPSHLAGWITPVTYIGLIGAALLITLVPARVRLVLLPPVLYLAAFVWENIMVAKPEPARYIALGLILIALMILRPNGLLGERRVEIV
ncbi:MAG: branched-chain amino acid ABC transporter permease [Actinomycetota bacterium]|nr:branched-chain amino acid ABC transporter permease [Actinomycetota bacterium]